MVNFTREKKVIDWTQQGKTENASFDERLFDLLPAAWGMKDSCFEKVAGLPPRWLWQWRNHYRAPDAEELARIRRLMRFHDAISLILSEDPDYRDWWQRPWRDDSLIGNRSPYEAITQEPALLDKMEAYPRAQV